MDAGRDSADRSARKPAEKTPCCGSDGNRMPYFLREYPRSFAHANFSAKNAVPLKPESILMARIAIVALVIAGFFITGDIPAVLQGGQRAVIAIAEVPRHLVGLFSAPDEGETATAPSGAPPAPLPARNPHHLMIPPAATTYAQLGDLRPGDRVLLWCRSEGSANGVELLAIDLIDPRRGEALLSRHLDATVALPDLATAAGQPPRRVVLEAAGIERAAKISFRPVLAGPAVQPVKIGQPSKPLLQTGPVIAVLTVSRD